MGLGLSRNMDPFVSVGAKQEKLRLRMTVLIHGPFKVLRVEYLIFYILLPIFMSTCGSVFWLQEFKGRACRRDGEQPHSKRSNSLSLRAIFVGARTLLSGGNRR